MPKNVYAKVPAAARDNWNDFLVGLYGDDPGDEVPAANAYLDGADPNVATYSFSGDLVMTAGQVVTTQNYLASVADSGVVVRDTPAADAWGLAFSTWALRPVNP